MELGFLSILALGFVLGIKHAIEPDHVIAVSTIASQSRKLSRSSLAGVFWGIGHTATLFIIGIILAVLFWPMIARGHGDADWIRQEGHRNFAGEFCCGVHDCFVVDDVALVTKPQSGYLLPGGEFVPQSEAKASRDGQYWRCKRPDGSRRCFFAPPPGS